MLWLGVVFITLTVSSTTNAAQWPNEIKRCSMNLTETEFNKCLFSSAKDAIPKLKNGMKEFRLPPLAPFRLFSDVTINANRKPLFLTFIISNGSAYGPTDFDLQKVRYDRDKLEFYFEGVHKNLTMTGGYSLKGEIYNFTMESKGVFRVETNDVHEVLGAKMTPAKKAGFVKPKFGYKVKGLKRFTLWIKDDTLPPAIERAFLDVVNENWKEVTKALIPAAEKGFKKQYNQLLSPLFKRFSYEDIIPGYKAPST